MATWTVETLDAVEGDDHLRIASRRPDGSLRPYVTIWFVRAGDDLFVRSAHGPQNGWYRRAVAAGEGRISVSGIERDVTFEVPDPSLGGDLGRAYHAKYDRYGPAIVGTVVSDVAARCTLRLVPR